MKRVISTLILGLSILLSTGVSAQKQKIGHINADNLLQLMPEIKDVQTQLEAYRGQLEKDLSEMETELETKIAAYRQNEQMMTQLSRETKAQEIQELQLRIQDYQQKAGQDLQNKQLELITPIIEKATKAVQEVAKENEFTYILDSSDSKAVVIFVDNGIDIMPLVKQKLGLQ